MNRGYKSRTIEVIIIIEATKRAMDMRGGEQKQRRCWEQYRRAILCTGLFEREKEKTQRPDERASSADKKYLLLETIEQLRILKIFEKEQSI